MPNFLVLGAAKSGTTSLYFYLKQHPQIHMSHIKEPEFFIYEGKKINFSSPIVINNIEDYCKLFQGVPKGIVMGEASTSYLYSPKASERIYHHIPDAKLIAILRHPAERAYSGFLHCLQRGLEPHNDFAQALQEEEMRIRNNRGSRLHYGQQGFYYVQLKRYFDKFDQEQIRVYLYDDLVTNPVNVIQNIFQFLGVDETFIPDMSHRYTTAAIPKNKIISALTTRMSPANSVFRLLLPAKLRLYIKSKVFDKPPLLPPELRNKLIDVYREDILKLQELIQRDLSMWLK